MRKLRWWGYLCALALLAGCQSMNQPKVNANVSHPAKDLAGNPYVLVVGDELVTSEFTQEVIADHPMWTAAGSAVGSMEESGSVLARLPALLAAKHYDVVVIEAGMYDVSDPVWDDVSACGDKTVSPNIQTCTNLETMVTLIHKAGAKAIMCLGPSIQSGSVGTPLLEADSGLGFEEYMFYRGWTIGYDPPPTEPDEPDWIIEMWQAMGQTDTGEGNDPIAGSIDWTDDGVHYNATGAQLAASATDTAISQLKVNWGLR